MDDVQLTTVLCELLGRVPGWTYLADPDYTYSPGAVAIVYGALPPEPDEAIGVRVYFTDDNRAQHFTARRVQVRFRGRRDRTDGADRLAGVAFTVLHGLARERGISGISRLSMAPLGADTNGREERTDNYIITLDNPEASS